MCNHTSSNKSYLSAEVYLSGSRESFHANRCLYSVCNASVSGEVSERHSSSTWNSILHDILSATSMSVVRYISAVNRRTPCSNVSEIRLYKEVVCVYSTTLNSYPIVS